MIRPYALDAITFKEKHLNKTERRKQRFPPQHAPLKQTTLGRLWILREDEAITPLGNDCTSFKGSEPGAVPSKTLVRNRGKEVKTALWWRPEVKKERGVKGWISLEIGRQCQGMKTEESCGEDGRCSPSREANPCLCQTVGCWSGEVIRRQQSHVRLLRGLWASFWRL